MVKKISFWLVLATLLSTLFALGSPACAASKASPKTITYKGITLTPAIENVSLSPGRAGATFKVTVGNTLKQPVSLAASSLDFRSLNESGGVAFIGSGASQLQHKFGLANWLTIPTQPILLKPGGSQDVSITINNRSDLSPGGHYAAVLFKATGASGSGTNRVNVNQVVSALVFVKKQGGEVYSLQLKDPGIGNQLVKLPSNIDLEIQNTGNTQTVPRGTLSITDPLGHQVRRGIINPDSSLVLPDSTRLYRTSIFKVARAWLPGRYRVVITYRPEDSDQATTAEYKFFYAALPSFIALGAGVTLSIFLARRYKKKIRSLKKDIHNRRKRS
jgi:hypothetical protein